MNASGELFASKFQAVGTFHHSSLAGGQPVAAAGELIVVDGKLVAISNQSGHYQPASSFTEQAVDALRARGLATAGVKMTDAGTKTQRTLAE